MKKTLTPQQKALRIVPFNKLPGTKAWKTTSELVRKKSKGICYTCERPYPFNKLVAGHFIEKRGNANVYFDMENLQAQCQWYCNRMLHGSKDVYAAKLIQEKGPKILYDLLKRAGKPKQWTQKELEEIYQERSAEIQKLEK